MTLVPDPGLGKAQKCGGGKTGNGVPTPSPWEVGLLLPYTHKQTIKNPHWLVSTHKRPHTITKNIYDVHTIHIKKSTFNTKKSQTSGTAFVKSHLLII